MRKHNQTDKQSEKRGKTSCSFLHATDVTSRIFILQKFFQQLLQNKEEKILRYYIFFARMPWFPHSIYMVRFSKTSWCSTVAFLSILKFLPTLQVSPCDILRNLNFLKYSWAISLWRMKKIYALLYWIIFSVALFQLPGKSPFINSNRKR